MTKKFEKLKETFNVSEEDQVLEAKSVEVEVGGAEIKSIEKSQSDIIKDYEYSRGNLYSIIEKGKEAIDGILELAQESEMPRAYEVAGQLIKSVADATDKLMDLQKKLNDIDSMKNQKGPTNVTNALFIGSTAELSKLLKGKLPDQKENKE
jgi:hypothetical protein